MSLSLVCFVGRDHHTHFRFGWYYSENRIVTLLYRICIFLSTRPYEYKLIGLVLYLDLVESANTAGAGVTPLQTWWTQK